MADVSHITYENSVLKTTTNSVKSFELEASATSIYGQSKTSYAFINCKENLESFTIPDGSMLQTIQQYAFYECKQLKEADLHKCTHLTSIGNYAFYQCSSLENVVFPDSLQTLGEYSFYASKVKTLDFPESLKSIGKYSFYYTKSLQTVSFGNEPNITTFTESLFRLSTIATITIPKSLTTIEDSVFETARSLKEIKVQDGNPFFISINNVLYDQRNLTLVRYQQLKHWTTLKCQIISQQLEKLLQIGLKLEK